MFKKEDKHLLITLPVVKAKVFDVIDSGELFFYLEKYKIPFTEKKKKEKYKEKDNSETTKPPTNEL